MLMTSGTRYRVFLFGASPGSLSTVRVYGTVRQVLTGNLGQTNACCLAWGGMGDNS